MPGKKIRNDRSVTEQLIKRVFALSRDIRYVAVHRNGKLGSVSKPNLGGASTWESDKYEELIVNPTLVTLLRQRGNIDCGGIQHVVIRYGNFIQFVSPLRGGHISVAFEPESDYNRVLPKIKRLLQGELLLEKNDAGVPS